MHSNGNSQMGNTTTHQRPATYNSSLKQALVTVDFCKLLEWNARIPLSKLGFKQVQALTLLLL